MKFFRSPRVLLLALAVAALAITAHFRAAAQVPPHSPEPPLARPDEKSKQLPVVADLLAIMNEAKSIGTVRVCVGTLSGLRPLEPEVIPELIRVGDRLGVWEPDISESKRTLGKELQDLIAGVAEDQKSEGRHSAGGQIPQGPVKQNALVGAATCAESSNRAAPKPAPTPARTAKPAADYPDDTALQAAVAKPVPGVADTAAASLKPDLKLLRKRVEEVCGLGVKDVRLEFRRNGECCIRFKPRSESEARSLGEKVLHMAELEPYQVKLELTIEP